MDMRKDIIDVFNTKNIAYTVDLINNVYTYLTSDNYEDLEKIVSKDIFTDLVNLKKITEENFYGQDAQLSEDIFLKWEIPNKLLVDKFTVEKPIKNYDLEILNFLNNEADIENLDGEDSVEKKMDLITKLLDEKKIVLVQGDTGCGKTTKIPMYLLKKYNSIVCTQPRRIAAISVAKRVAHCMGSKVGDLVGYAVRFDDRTSAKTKLKYVTDGILLSEMIHRGNLNRYDCLIIDEAHERTINIDILLGICKQIINENSKLRILLMSATMSTQKFVDFFNCPFVNIKHKVFPLENYFLKQYNSENWFDETIKTVIQIHNTEPKGDILVFLTGQEEIKDAYQILTTSLNLETCKILMIYSAMSINDQEEVFLNTEKRKIVLSTNICETSVTIENIVYVVDSGRVKQMRHSCFLGLDILETLMISKAQAKQRSGRAGRTGPGKTFRIYTKQEFLQMKDSLLPEILTTNVCKCILTIKSLGINNLNNFKMIDMPNPDSINDALEYLFLARAVDSVGDITDLGRKMARLPLDPYLSLTLIRSEELGCFEDVAIIAAMLTVDQIYVDVKKDDNFLYKKFLAVKSSWNDDRGDFFVLLKIFNAWKKEKYSNKFCKYNFLSLRNMWQAKKIKDQLSFMFNYNNSSNKSKVIEAFSFGYFMNIAKIKEDGYYTIFKQTECYIHSSSCLYKKREPFILYFSIVRTKREFLKFCNVVTPEILCKSVNNVFIKKK